MLSQLFILSSQGDRLLHKDFRGDPPELPDVFYRRVTALPGDQAPVFMAHGGRHFAHVRHRGLYVGAVATEEASPFAVVELLGRLVTLLRDFCGNLSERSLGTNLALVSELLDEALDDGHVQTTSPEVLSSVLQAQPEATKPFSLLDLGSVGLFGADTQQSRLVPSTAAARPVLPPRGDQAARNEIFVDVIERLTVVIAADGTPLKADVRGEIRLKCFVPGASELRIGLSEEFCVGRSQLRGYGTPARADSCSFHASVSLEEFWSGRVLRVPPPQGELTLMQYELSDDLPAPLPFRLLPALRPQGPGRLWLHLKLRCDLPPTSQALNVRLELLLPRGVTRLSHEVTPPQSATLEGGGAGPCAGTSPAAGGGPGWWQPSSCRCPPAPPRRWVPPMSPSSSRRTRPRGCGSASCGGGSRGGGAGDGTPPPPQRWLRHLTHSDSYVLRL